MGEKKSRPTSALPSRDHGISLSENPQEIPTLADKMPAAADQAVKIADLSPNNQARPMEAVAKNPNAQAATRAKRPIASDVVPDDSDVISESVEEADFAEVEPETLASYQLPAVRLADDVQLPAVILTLNEEQIDPENKTPQPIKDAMKSIVDKFYTNIAESAAEGDYVSKDPDGTLVVGKGPGVERAREEADQIYRALFGEEAYNRMTMDSLLESQLPVVDSSVEGQDTSPAQP